MRIGIDISQTAFEHSGVANYVTQLVTHLVKIDTNNQYVLFFSSLRKPIPQRFLTLEKQYKHVVVKRFRFPPTLLDTLWNMLHVLPIEVLIGQIDVFISSDWVQPPTKAKSFTILYDLVVYLHPEETDKKIVETQKRRLSWVKKECDKILCISESTKKDAKKILGIDEERLAVTYPGIL